MGADIARRDGATSVHAAAAQHRRRRLRPRTHPSIRTMPSPHGPSANASRNRPRLDDSIQTRSTHHGDWMDTTARLPVQPQAALSAPTGSPGGVFLAPSGRAGPPPLGARLQSMPLGTLLLDGAGAGDDAPVVLREGSFSPTFQRESTWPSRSCSGVSCAATRRRISTAGSLPPDAAMLK